MLIDRKLFDSHLHHIDFALAPFQHDDFELCLRAWMQGLQVGWYDAGFKSLTAGGMRIWNKKLSDELSQRNDTYLYALYRDTLSDIRRACADANSLLTLERFGAVLPEGLPQYSPG